jgi:hypothetical protein
MGTSTPNAPAPAVMPRSPSARLRAVIVVLLINAVPLVGVLRYGWSATNVLVLYWFENLVVAILTTARLIVHRRLTRKRGYWRTSQLGIKVNDRPVKSGFVAEYATGAFAFTLGHGVFVAVIALLLAQNHPDEPMWHLGWPQVGRGVLVISAMLVVEFCVDLGTIRSASFAAVKQYAQARMARVVVLHLAIIFGMLGMAVTDSPLSILYVLIGLKTLVELGAAASRGAAASESGAPPAWTLKMADRFAKDKGGATGFVQQYRHDMDAERRQAIEDEEAMPAR